MHESGWTSFSGPNERLKVAPAPAYILTRFLHKMCTTHTTHVCAPRVEKCSKLFLTCEALLRKGSLNIFCREREGKIRPLKKILWMQVDILICR